MAATVVEWLIKELSNSVNSSLRVISPIGAVPGERRRIKHDQIPTRNDLLVRFCERLFFKPIEHVHRFEGALRGQTIPFCIAASCGQGFRALIEKMNVCCPGAGRVEAEAA